MKGETLVESLQAVDTQSGLCLIISFITYGIVWRSEVTPSTLLRDPQMEPGSSGSTAMLV